MHLGWRLRAPRPSAPLGLPASAVASDRSRNRVCKVLHAPYLAACRSRLFVADSPAPGRFRGALSTPLPVSEAPPRSAAAVGTSYRAPSTLPAAVACGQRSPAATPPPRTRVPHLTGGLS